MMEKDFICHQAETETLILQTFMLNSKIKNVHWLLEDERTICLLDSSLPNHFSVRQYCSFLHSYSKNCPFNVAAV